MAKKRLSRKELKQPDKVLSTMERGVEVVSAHRRLLLIGVGVLVLAVGAYVFYRYRTGAKAEEGQKLFQKGLRIYTASVDPSVKAGAAPKKGEEVQSFRTVEDRAKAALGVFDRIVSDYEGYPVARIAHFYRGRCYYDLRRFGDAIASFKKVLSSKGGGCSGGPDMPGSGALQALALENLGYAQSAKGRLDDARRTFAKLRELDKGSRRDWGYYHEALVLEAKGDLRGAIAAYEKVKSTGQDKKGQDPSLGFSVSPLTELATKRARYLQMKLEAKEPAPSPRRRTPAPRPAGDDMAPASDDMAPASDDMAPAMPAPAMPAPAMPAPAMAAPAMPAPAMAAPAMPAPAMATPTRNP